MRVLITGASGSGTSTLAGALATSIGGFHLEADNYLWEKTNPPFKIQRLPEERLELLLADLQAASNPILAGSIVGWGTEVEDTFDLIVFLYVDSDIRIDRLRKRETEIHGRVNPDFLFWAAQYDSGTTEGRSLPAHRRWLAERNCRIIELHGDLSVQERVSRVLGGA